MVWNDSGRSVDSSPAVLSPICKKTNKQTTASQTGCACSPTLLGPAELGGTQQAWEVPGWGFAVSLVTTIIY